MSLPPVSPSQGATRGTVGPTPDLKAGNVDKGPRGSVQTPEAQHPSGHTPFPWTPGLAHLVPRGVFPDLTPYQFSWEFPALATWSSC